MAAEIICKRSVQASNIKNTARNAIHVSLPGESRLQMWQLRVDDQISGARRKFTEGQDELLLANKELATRLRQCLSEIFKARPACQVV